jgi:restriction endonuclease Mrr
MQTFIGMMTVHHRADQGLFVTTAGFTQPARNLAAHHGILLIDGNDLMQLVQGKDTRIRRQIENQWWQFEADRAHSASPQ